MTGRTIGFFVSHAAGGIRELVSDIGEGFLDAGYGVRLVALYAIPANANDAPQRLRWDYIVPDHPHGPLGKLRMVGRLAAWLRREKPDVIVTSMPAVNVLVPILARLFSPRSRVLMSHHSPTQVYNRTLDAIDTHVGQFRNIEAIICVSDAVSNSLDHKPSRYKRKRRTIRNALPRRIDTMLAELAGAAPRRVRHRRLIAIGRLAPEKNLPMLLRAVAGWPDVTVDLVGSGPEEAMLRDKVATLGITQRTRFLGHRERGEALRMLADADIFVQVSLFEGHSLAVIEAAKLGLPLIVSNVPAQVEAVTLPDGMRCGIVIGLDDDAGLERAIGDLLGDTTIYQDWSARALRLAEESTFGAMIAQYDALAR